MEEHNGICVRENDWWCFIYQLWVWTCLQLE